MVSEHLNTALLVQKSDGRDILTGLHACLRFGFETLLVIEAAIARISAEDFEGHTRCCSRTCKQTLKNELRRYGLYATDLIPLLASKKKSRST